MGLGLPTTGDGDFINYCKYNAKAGRWASKYDKDDVREVADMTAIFNFAEIKTGNFLFGDGMAPEKHFNSSLTNRDAEKPTDKFKPGFEVLVYSEKNLGGLREFCSTAAIVNDVMNDLYDLYEAQAASNPGMQPVVRCTNTVEVKGAHGSNYKPVLEIVQWAPWPDLNEGAADALEALQATPASSAAIVPPPSGAATQQQGDAF